MGAIVVRAVAPGKVILLGEHAVNRGSLALAISVGLYSTCTLTLTEQPYGNDEGYSFRTPEGQERARTSRDAILALASEIDRYRARNEYAALQRLARDDFFAAAKYVLAAAGARLPARMEIVCASEVPPSSGLGSGGSIFVALAAALAHLIGDEEAQQQVPAWAVRGDIVAHGGTASGLDTQTIYHGGAIRYSTARGGEPIPYANGLRLVIGNTGVRAATGQVNGRVRSWLEQRPGRLHYFQEIGLLAQHAENLLHAGDWVELGQLLNLNQLLLERIGVSSPELEALIEAALEAGALGAKLSGSGGGGIMIALVTPDTVSPVAQAITAAGGSALVVPIGVPGVRVTRAIEHEE